MICLGFLILGKQYVFQKRDIEQLHDRLDWTEEDIKVLADKFEEVIKTVKVTKINGEDE